MPRATQKGKVCILESAAPYRSKGQSVELTIVFLGVFVSFYLEWKVKKFTKGICPKGSMSCIGKYKRNLVTMKETKTLFCLSQTVLLLQMAFLVSLPKLEKYLTAKDIFWIYNSIYLIGFVIELIYHRQVIIPTFEVLSSMSMKPNKKRFFSTKLPTVLEPRREYVKIKETKPKQIHKRKVMSWKGPGKGKTCSSLPPVE